MFWRGEWKDRVTGGVGGFQVPRECGGSQAVSRDDGAEWKQASLQGIREPESIE